MREVGDQRACMQQIRQRPQRRRQRRTVRAGCLGIGPGGRDQRLAAIGQHQQQLQIPVPPHPAQHA
jgi:hypothetical protein